MRFSDLKFINGFNILKNIRRGSTKAPHETPWIWFLFCTKLSKLLLYIWNCPFVCLLYGYLSCTSWIYVSFADLWKTFSSYQLQKKVRILYDDDYSVSSMVCLLVAANFQLVYCMFVLVSVYCKQVWQVVLVICTKKIYNLHFSFFFHIFPTSHSIRFDTLCCTNTRLTLYRKIFVCKQLQFCHPFACSTDAAVFFFIAVHFEKLWKIM